MTTETVLHEETRHDIGLCTYQTKIDELWNLENRRHHWPCIFSFQKNNIDGATPPLVTDQRIPSTFVGFFLFMVLSLTPSCLFPFIRYSRGVPSPKQCSRCSQRQSQKLEFIQPTEIGTDFDLLEPASSPAPHQNHPHLLHS